MKYCSKTPDVITNYESNIALFTFIYRPQPNKIFKNIEPEYITKHMKYCGEPTYVSKNNESIFAQWVLIYATTKLKL